MNPNERINLIQKLNSDWNALAFADPLFAILTHDGKEDLKWGHDEFFKTGKEEIQDLINQIRKLGVEFHSTSVLDFGCGVGRNSQAFADYFEKVVGVDISDRMIEMAINYNSKLNVEYYVNQTDTLSIFEKEQFDLIYSNIVLQHIPTQLSIFYFQEFFRILRTGGILIFQVPDRMNNRLCNLLWSKKLFHKIIMPIINVFRGEIKSKIDMYPITNVRVHEILRENHLNLIAEIKDNSPGPKWISYTYYARK